MSRTSSISVSWRPQQNQMSTATPASDTPARTMRKTSDRAASTFSTWPSCWRYRSARRARQLRPAGGLRPRLAASSAMTMAKSLCSWTASTQRSMSSSQGMRSKCLTAPSSVPAMRMYCTPSASRNLWATRMVSASCAALALSRGVKATGTASPAASGAGGSPDGSVAVRRSGTRARSAAASCATKRNKGQGAARRSSMASVSVPKALCIMDWRSRSA
mmetsp:Transcript_105625/g.340640  ORF Transcript_105625/g.340640 Transcript_105625/m.340640 type:complete len:218 (+) Transcript_105625:376-1029(+)